MYTPEIQHRYQEWPYLKGDTFKRPSFWTSMFVFGGVHPHKNPTEYYHYPPKSHVPIPEAEKLSICWDLDCWPKNLKKVPRESSWDSRAWDCRRSRKNLPSRELTYLTLQKGKSSSKVPLGGDMLVPRRVCYNGFVLNRRIDLPFRSSCLIVDCTTKREVHTGSFQIAESRSTQHSQQTISAWPEKGAKVSWFALNLSISMYTMLL